MSTGITLPKLKLSPAILKTIQSAPPKVKAELKKLADQGKSEFIGKGTGTPKWVSELNKRIGNPEEKLKLLQGLKGEDLQNKLKGLLEKVQLKTVDGKPLSLPGLKERALHFSEEFAKLKPTLQKFDPGFAPVATNTANVDTAFSPATGVNGQAIDPGFNPGKLEKLLGKAHGLNLGKLQELNLGKMVGHPATLDKVNAAIANVTKDRDQAMHTLSVTKPGSLEHMRAQLKLHIDNARLKMLEGAKAKLEKMHPAPVNPDKDWGIDGQHPSRAVLDKAIKDATAARDHQAHMMSISRYTPEGYKAAKAKLDALNADLDRLTTLKAKLYPEPKPAVSQNPFLTEAYANSPIGGKPTEKALDGAIGHCKQEIASLENLLATARFIKEPVELHQKLASLKANLAELESLKAKLYPPSSQPNVTLPTQASADGLVHDGRFGPGHGEMFQPSGLTSTQEHHLVNLKHAGATDAELKAVYDLMMAANAIPGASTTSSSTNAATGTTTAAGTTTSSSTTAATGTTTAGTTTSSSTNAATGTTTATGTSAPRDAGTVNNSKLDLNAMMNGLSDSQKKDLEDMKAAGCDDKQIKMQQMQFKMQNMSELMSFISNMSKMQNETLRALIGNLR